MISVRPITPASLKLSALKRRTIAIHGFMDATVDECGGVDNPACVQLLRTTLRELLQLHFVYDRAERRVGRS
jgi:hypothetical protein